MISDRVLSSFKDSCGYWKGTMVFTGGALNTGAVPEIGL